MHLTGAMWLQALHHVAKRLAQMHAAGWAHLDVKPRNVLRRPRQHAWTLIDFGCSARIGASRGTLGPAVINVQRMHRAIIVMTMSAEIVPP